MQIPVYIKLSPTTNTEYNSPKRSPSKEVFRITNIIIKKNKQKNSSLKNKNCHTQIKKSMRHIDFLH